MRQSACLFVLVGALLMPANAAGQAQWESAVVTREALPPVTNVSLAGETSNRIDPLPEQVAMAVVLVGLAAALRRWQPGKRPGITQPRT